MKMNVATAMYSKEATAKGRATKLTKQTGIPHEVAPTSDGQFIVVQITKPEKPAKKKAEPKADGTTKFVIKKEAKERLFVSNTNGGYDAWKFHSYQFDTVAMAVKFADEHGIDMGHHRVVPFHNAWTEAA